MKKEILDEIKEIAPKLVSLDKKAGLDIPSDYFSKIEDDVFNSLSLDKVDKAVPDGYFESLADKVLEKSQSSKPAKVISIDYRKWAAAASVIFIGLFGLWTLNDGSSTTPQFSDLGMDSTIEEDLDYLFFEDEILLSDVLDFVDDEILEELDILSSDLESDDPYLEDLIYTLDEDQLKELL